MISFAAILKKFGNKGEKTGWTYIDIPEKLANELNPQTKKSFRVKGKIDNYEFSSVALTPMGDGNFILAVNASIRKAIKKIHGAKVILTLNLDTKKLPLSAEMMECLKDEPCALHFFEGLPEGHQNWFSNWVKNAKTTTTIARRIATVVDACSNQLSFSEMMKSYKKTDITIL